MPRPRMDENLLRTVARLAGCDCDPDFETWWGEDGIGHIEIMHDDDCTLYRAMHRGSN